MCPSMRQHAQQILDVLDSQAGHSCHAQMAHATHLADVTVLPLLLLGFLAGACGGPVLSALPLVHARLPLHSHSLALAPPSDCAAGSCFKAMLASYTSWPWQTANMTIMLA